MADSPKKGSDGVLKLVITSNGSEIDSSFKVISVAVKKKANKIPWARIVMEDGDMPEGDFPLSNKETFKPGAEISINAGYGQDDENIFQGIVIRHGIRITGNNLSRLVVECRDKAIRMTVGRNNANYMDSKDSDIITTLIGNHSCLSSDVEATSIEYRELVQYYCTDWDFMLARAEVNGFVVLTEDSKVSVKPPDTGSDPVLKVTYGNDLMEFKGEIDAASQLASVTGTAWDQKKQEVIRQEGERPELNEQGDLDSEALSKVMAPDVYGIQTSVPVGGESLKSWADARLLKSGLSRIRGSMTFQGSAAAKPGGLIELEGVGNRFNGNVFVSVVTHEISRGNWFTKAEFGLDPHWFLERRDIEAPLSSGFLPGVQGLQIGIVKKLDEDPEGEYRVQVSVPVMQAESDGVWARLSNFYGSGGVGSFFIPEVGDEVVLGYLNNDPCHPVILGSLYSSKNKPPCELTAENNTKALVTKSEMKIEFDEEKKVTTIETPGGNKIVISDDDKSILLSDQNSNQVKLGSDGILLDSPKDIKITAKGKVTIDATGELGVTSKADVNVKGLNINNTADVGFVGKGSATAEVSASGQTTVKGAMVMIN